MDSIKSQTQNPQRLHATKIRRKVITGVEDFFENQGFTYTDTPLLVQNPGMEPHIRPVQVKSYGTDSPLTFLPTSPEFAMKKLLVGGLDKIFQICPAFRVEPHSNTHHTEFTLLEWYRADDELETIMKDCEKLITQLTKEILKQDFIEFEGTQVSLKAPWPKWSTNSLFKKYCDIDLVKNKTSKLLHRHCNRLEIASCEDEPWDDLYFKIWLNCIEPKLPKDQAFFVTDYPPSQCALAEVSQDKEGNHWSKRFEVYIGGLELANAFQELTDVKEYKTRFDHEMQIREKAYGTSFPKTPIDTSFLEAIQEGLPRSAGIALGVDRLIMLLANESNIEMTKWLTSTELAKL